MNGNDLIDTYILIDGLEHTEECTIPLSKACDEECSIPLSKPCDEECSIPLSKPCDEECSIPLSKACDEECSIPLSKACDEERYPISVASLRLVAHSPLWLHLKGDYLHTARPPVQLALIMGCTRVPSHECTL